MVQSFTFLSRYVGSCVFIAHREVMTYPSLSAVININYTIFDNEKFLKFTVKNCGSAPDIMNGNVNERSLVTLFNSTVDYSCASQAYILEGNSTIRCTEDGTWSRRPSCRGKIWSVCLTSSFEHLRMGVRVVRQNFA